MRRAAGMLGVALGLWMGAAQALEGGGRVAEVSVAAGRLVVADTALRLDAGTQVYDYAGKRVSASTLTPGMSVHYVAQPPAEGGGVPAAREVRMIPN